MTDKVAVFKLHSWKLCFSTVDHKQADVFWPTGNVISLAVSFLCVSDINQLMFSSSSHRLNSIFLQSTAIDALMHNDSGFSLFKMNTIRS